MNKMTAVSPANIAFIKYWGKRDSKLNIPFNDSVSMNLSGCLTTTTVEFKDGLASDEVFIDGRIVEGAGWDRVVFVLDEVRKMAKINLFAKVTSKNNFPSDAGIASSASGFSALALAASTAAGLKISQRKLSILARLGSGSACRSIPDGFTFWKKGKDSSSSYAVQIARPDFWDLRDIVVVVSKEKKKTGSTEGHAVATSSPYFKERLLRLPGRIKRIKRALLKKDFDAFGRILEEEAIDLHVMAMTSKPPILYWNKGTMETVHAVLEMREKGLKCFFTMDAGPNVHVICRGRDEPKVRKVLEKLESTLFVISNRSAKGARIKTTTKSSEENHLVIVPADRVPKKIEIIKTGGRRATPFCITEGFSLTMVNLA